MLQSDEDERAQMYAGKLLEVLLLDYRGQINQYAPKFIELALTRLTKPIVASELRVMCLQASTGFISLEIIQNRVLSKTYHLRCSRFNQSRSGSEQSKSLFTSLMKY